MNYLGIDLSKKYFDVTLLNEQGEKSQAKFDNNASGFGKLSKWLKEKGVVELHACMEATNIYWEGVAQSLHDKGHQVSVVGAFWAQPASRDMRWVNCAGVKPTKLMPM